MVSATQMHNNNSCGTCTKIRLLLRLLLLQLVVLRQLQLPSRPTGSIVVVVHCLPIDVTTIGRRRYHPRNVQYHLQSRSVLPVIHALPLQQHIHSSNDVVVGAISPMVLLRAKHEQRNNNNNKHHYCTNYATEEEDDDNYDDSEVHHHIKYRHHDGPGSTTIRHNLSWNDNNFFLFRYDDNDGDTNYNSSSGSTNRNPMSMVVATVFDLVTTLSVLPALAFGDGIQQQQHPSSSIVSSLLPVTVVTLFLFALLRTIATQLIIISPNDDDDDDDDASNRMMRISSDNTGIEDADNNMNDSRNEMEKTEEWMTIDDDDTVVPLQWQIDGTTFILSFFIAALLTPSSSSVLSTTTTMNTEQNSLTIATSLPSLAVPVLLIALVGFGLVWFYLYIVRPTIDEEERQLSSLSSSSSSLSLEEILLIQWDQKFIQYIQRQQDKETKQQRRTKR